MRGRGGCPNSKSTIEPTLFQCLPPRHSRKHFRCPNCGVWLIGKAGERALFLEGQAQWHLVDFDAKSRCRHDANHDLSADNDFHAIGRQSMAG